MEKTMKDFLNDSKNLWIRKAYFYIIKFENEQNLYKYGITTDFAQRKANLKQEWKSRNIEIIIETLALIPMQSFAKAIIIESKVRLKLLTKKIQLFGNDYFETDDIEKTLNIIQNIIEK